MTDQILAVQKMQDYIEAHLKEDITLAALGSVKSRIRRSCFYSTNWNLSVFLIILFTDYNN